MFIKVVCVFCVRESLLGSKKHILIFVFDMYFIKKRSRTLERRI